MHAGLHACMYDVYIMVQVHSACINLCVCGHKLTSSRCGSRLHACMHVCMHVCMHLVRSSEDMHACACMHLM
jgi:hypothetical protein